MRRLSVALALLLVACQGEPLVCTLVGGGPSGVTFDASEFQPIDPELHWFACVEELCESATFEGEDSRVFEDSIFVRYEFEDEDVFKNGPEVRFRLKYDKDTVLFEATATPPLFVTQPNGPQCEPTLITGAVRATEDGVLVPVNEAPWPDRSTPAAEFDQVPEAD